MKNLDETDIQLLEDYWQGQLDATASAALEQRLAEDPVFAAAAGEWKLLLEEGFGPASGERRELEAIKIRLKSYAETEGKPPKDTQPTPSTNEKAPALRRIYLAVAAAAAVLLLFLFTPLKNIFQPDDPYAEYFAHLPRDNANLSDDAETGQEAYDRQDYKTAYPLLLEEVAAGGDSLNLIYAGVAAVGSGQGAEAISILEPLLQSDKWQFYQEEIRWYLALAYVNRREADKANDLLNAIVRSNASYAEEAASLLQQLE
ncbi:tetratricopeptide repeat protein [Flavilitoribacter nigricans]|uniref:Tetratricopeptide repeat protein n=1 Tax=Flavilitoribacter nigricans (strain ATCC 23147 / DSM 23189 / NBRC 102662 / NCIMB 1420 / SS-2) TaxID=1122177 RepID=A0A2D0N1G8_FLAN2|nr:tetratricopeptide repeat protein [Flavilitoribacter nigricans]PHN01563.1 hypothetical protein CRP01_36290 [Flavilitoribacter nigricans DSM 23189 = NBRC 102662]